jgi:hypothetical protein
MSEDTVASVSTSVKAFGPDTPAGKEAEAEGLSQVESNVKQTGTESESAIHRPETDSEDGLSRQKTATDGTLQVKPRAGGDSGKDGPN